MLNAEQIEKNWNTLIEFIKDNFSGERRENLLNLYNTFENRMSTAPASGKVYFHSCFIGGYVHHVLNVLKIAPKASNLWETIGGEKTWTDEELFFVALNHDLGKVGDLEQDYYIETTEDWKIRRGIRFDLNPNLYYMKVADRSLFLLQHFGVKMTPREFVTINIHDGLYDEGNKAYYIQWGDRVEPDRFMHIINFADLMAAKTEYEEWAKTFDGKQFLSGKTGSKINPKITKNKKSKIFNSETLKDEDIKINKFEDLFGNVFGDEKK